MLLQVNTVPMIRIPFRRTSFSGAEDFVVLYSRVGSRAFPQRITTAETRENRHVPAGCHYRL
jgi:hypothetical protein